VVLKVGEITPFVDDFEEQGGENKVVYSGTKQHKGDENA